jgi:hypothetical protein
MLFAEYSLAAILIDEWVAFAVLAGTGHGYQLN